MNLEENIVLPEGFSYTIKNVSSPAYGILTNKVKEFLYILPTR